MHACIFVILLVTLLSSCTKKPVSGTILPDAGFLYEEKIADIPLPRGLPAVAGYTDKLQGPHVLLVRHAPFDVPTLDDFYMRMLDQMGWRLCMHSVGDKETLMVWEKSYKMCVLSLRAGVKKTLLVIQVGNKYL